VQAKVFTSQKQKKKKRKFAMFLGCFILWYLKESPLFSKKRVQVISKYQQAKDYDL
jgi:hypothetical protein